MRPESHREATPRECCGNCVHGVYPKYKDHLLCFFGDEIEIVDSTGEKDSGYVILDGVEVGLTEGDEYDKIWAGRVTNWCDVCDEFKERSGTPDGH